MLKNTILACLAAVLSLCSVEGMAQSHNHHSHHSTHRASTKHERKQSPARHVVIQSKTKDASRPPFVVAIDAGHGGKDVGAIGPRGTYEKQVVYSISRQLERMIDKDSTMLPVMVRKGDRFIGLGQRSAIARHAGADLFVSLHADAFHDDDVQGSSVYTLLNRKGRSGPNASTRKASNRAAAKILGELRSQQPLHCPHVKRARYAVLRTPGVPSMLIETGFITNPLDEKKLANPTHQQKIARSIYHGIQAYARTARPKLAKPARTRNMMVASRQ